MFIRDRHDRLALILSLLALGAASCGAREELEPGGEPLAPQPLCDGSNDARLTYLVEGGFVDNAYGFYGAYGLRFFVIDGACRYWASGDPVGTVRQGTLSAEQAADIAAKLHFKEIPALSAYPDRESCPDAGLSTLNAGGRAITCTCGCTKDLPAAIGQAFDQVHGVHADLFSRGAESDGPLRALTLAIEGGPKSPAPPSKTIDWPLPWNPATIAAMDPFNAASGKAIDDVADRLTLRSLRAMAVPRMTSPYVFVRTSDGAVFSLFARDEPPEPVVQAVKNAPPR